MKGVSKFMKKVAIIDLGSNSVRMNIAKINSDGTTEVISQNKKMVRLSQGMGDDMNLKVTPMYRTIAALSEFNDIIEENGVTDITAIATAAVRKAANQAAFLKEVKDAIGIDIKVISGDMEAIYDYLGVMSKLDVSDCVIVDIGGGSTEIILVKNGEIVDKTSLPIGAVSISEKFLQENESKENIELATKFAESYINAVEFLNEAKGLPIIGLGGSNRTIAKIDMKEVDSEKMLHGHEVSIAKVFEIYNAIVNTSMEERKHIKGVGKERADIIVGGMLTIVSIINKITASSLIISDSGVRDGILFEKMVENFNRILNSCKAMDRGMVYETSASGFNSEPVSIPTSSFEIPKPDSDLGVNPSISETDEAEEMSAYDALFQTGYIPEPPVKAASESTTENIDEPVSEVGYSQKLVNNDNAVKEPEITPEEAAEKAAYEALFAPRFD